MSSTASHPFDRLVDRTILRGDCPCGACGDRWAVGCRAAAVAIAPYLFAIGLGTTVLHDGLASVVAGASVTGVVMLLVLAGLSRARDRRRCPA